MDALTPSVLPAAADLGSTPASSGRFPDGEPHPHLAGTAPQHPEGGAAVEGSADVADVDGPSPSGNGDFVNLFERARQALTSRLQLEPGIAEALALPGSSQSGWPAGTAGDLPPVGLRTAPARLAAQLVVDERTRRLVVRVVDIQSRSTLRELPPATLAAIAAKRGRVIANGKR